MRAAEWIEASYFAVTTTLALLLPLTPRRRLGALALGAAGLGTVAATTLLSSPDGIVRDWTPAPLMLVAYWQAGQAQATRNLRFERWLGAVDERLRPLGLWLQPPRPVASLGRAWLELAYLLCYPIPPLGLAALYVAGLRRHADDYWLLVLAPAYLCYGMVALLPTMPPRIAGAAPALPPGRLRRFNLWILRHLSIQTNTFPSAHVAASLGAALALMRHAPAAGLPALLLALSIAAATVAGRYHYVLDGVVASLLAVAAWALTR